MPINEVIKDVQHRMDSSIQSLHAHFKTLRTGRAKAGPLGWWSPSRASGELACGRGCRGEKCAMSPPGDRSIHESPESREESQVRHPQRRAATRLDGIHS